MKKVTCILDGELVAAQAGTTILAAAESRGIFIPALCHSHDVQPRASCYLCVVEVEGQSDLVPSCSTEVADGMVIRTGTERVRTARRTCLDLLLSDHRGDCLGPCMTACPAGIDIPGFIQHVALGEERQAFQLIVAAMPFAGSLGRICDRPCETACRRQLVEDPVAICHLKRYVSDQAFMTGADYYPQKLPPTGKRIAIVGAGPAGLSAAYFLLVQGHECTVFDDNQKPGGMLRYGIPSFRLPPDVLDREIAMIEKLGAEIHCNKRVGKDIGLPDLQRRYEAVFIGIGAQKPIELNVPGEQAAGVMPALAFLREHGNAYAARIGSKVIVIGGGGAAVDAARVARRHGAPEVHIYCLEKQHEMTAPQHDLEAAREEGVVIHTERGVQSVVAAGGRVTGVVLKRCCAVFDERGRFNPRYSEAETSADDCETLVIAAGQRPDPSCLEGAHDMRARMTAPATPDYGRLLLHVDDRTLQTPIQNIFAGGDCVTGAGTAVGAVAAGRKAAMAMDQFVRGEKVVGEPESYRHSMGQLEEIPEKVFQGHTPAARVKMPQLEARARLASFSEVDTGFTGAMARTEAQRCIACGCQGSEDCRLRRYAGLYDADARRYAGACREYDRTEVPSGIVYDAHKCIQCHTCIRIADEVLGSPLMRVVDRGFNTRIRPAHETPAGALPRSGLIKIVEHCPTGALSFKETAAQPAGMASEAR